MRLECSVEPCAGVAVGTLSVWNDAGIDLAPLLSGITPGLHFSAEGELDLGRLGAGSYLFRLESEGRRWEREAETSPGDVLVELSPVP